MSRLGQSTLAVLSNATVDGNVVRLNSQLSRTEYVTVNKALEALGGRWDRKARGHVFSVDPAERLDEAILTGEIERPQDFGFFPTQPLVAELVVGRASIANGMRVLEPSAGAGSLIDAVRSRKQVNVLAIELLEDNYRTLLGKYRNLPDIEIVRGDFLLMPPKPIFQRVIMNPPFARQADIMHVEHAWKWLEPGGRLVSIMSAGVEFRQDKRATAFRHFVEEHGEIEPLPSGSFRSSGTDVNTVVVTIGKGRDDE